MCQLRCVKSRLASVYFKAMGELFASMVADETTQLVITNAPDELLTQIANLFDQAG